MMSFLFLAQTLAVIVAFVFAAGDIVGRLAVRHSTPYTGALLGTLAGLAVFALIALGHGYWEDVNLTGIFWFFAAGVFYPGLGYITIFKAFECVGVARTAPILCISPLISVTIAVLFMGERPGFFVLCGTVLIVLGVVSISLEKDDEEGGMSFRKLLWPLLTAVCFGATPLLRKTGLQYLPSPVMGMLFSSLGGLFALLACVGFIPRAQRFSRHRLGAVQYILTGLIYALAVYLYFLALGKGTVSVVVPLVLTYPLFVLIVMALAFKKLERITPRLVVGALLTVAGAGVITGLG